MNPGPTDERRRSRVFDVLAVALLLATAWMLLLRHARDLFCTIDGYTLSFLMLEKRLPYVTWVPIKDEPGRPFIGLAHRLVHDLFGGSVTSYNIAFLLCLVASVLGVYAAVRLLFPRQPLLAAAAALLKISSPLNHQLLFNHSLSIFFAEVLVVLGFVAMLAAGLHARSAVARGIVAAGVGVAVFIATGIYQSLWPVIVLAPVLGVPAMRGRGGTWRGLLVAWYGSFAACALLSLVNLVVFPSTLVTDADLATITGRFIAGAASVLVETWWRPAVFLAGDRSIVTALLALALIALWAVPLRLARGDRETTPSGLGWWAVVGLLLAVTPLLPPSVQATPVYGTRYAHLAVYGWLALVLVVAGGAWTSRRRGVRVTAVLLVASLVFFGTYFRLRDADRMAASGARVFARTVSVIEHGAGVPEGTVIVTDGGTNPRRDTASTIELRMISDTWATFWLTDGDALAAQDPRGDVVTVRTWMDLTLTADDLRAGHAAPWKWWTRRPLRTSGEPEVHTFPAERRVGLRWNAAFNRYAIDPSASNPTRVASPAASSLADTLFPGHDRWRGGSFVLRGSHTVLAEAGADPVRVRRGLDWFAPEAAVLVTKAPASLTLDAEHPALLVHAAIPAGADGHFRLAFAVDDPAAAVAVHDDRRGVRLDDLLFGPGDHDLRLRLLPGTATDGRCTLSSFSIAGTGTVFPPRP